MRGKRHHPACTPMHVDRRVLRSIYIHEAVYDENLRPVCPHCGQYNMRVVDSGPSPKNKRHLGRRYYTGICTVPGCNIAYRFYDDPSWLREEE